MGQQALSGLKGIQSVQSGMDGSKEINTVQFDPSDVTLAQMVEALKGAGTCIAVHKPVTVTVANDDMEVMASVDRGTYEAGESGVIYLSIRLLKEGINLNSIRIKVPKGIVCESENINLEGNARNRQQNVTKNIVFKLAADLEAKEYRISLSAQYSNHKAEEKREISATPLFLVTETWRNRKQ